MSKQPKPVRAWGGFSSNRLDDWGGEQYGYSSGPRLMAVFKYLSDARDRYQDVRRVTITPDPPKRAKKKAVGVVVDYAGRVSEWRSEGGGLSLKQPKKSKRPMVENEKKKARKR